MKRALLLALAIIAAAPLLAADAFQVIVHADNPAKSVAPQTVQEFFMGKARRWSDGTTVVPVDQVEKSAVRAAFSQAVLKKRVEAVKSYWLTLIFSGRGTPPVEQKTDAAVMEAVQKDRGAIGYVAADATLIPGVRAIPVK